MYPAQSGKSKNTNLRKSLTTGPIHSCVENLPGDCCLRHVFLRVGPTVLYRIHRIPRNLRTPTPIIQRNTHRTVLRSVHRRHLIEGIHFVGSNPQQRKPTIRRSQIGQQDPQGWWQRLATGMPLISYVVRLQGTVQGDSSQQYARSVKIRTSSTRC